MSYSPKAFQILTLGTSQIGKFISTHGTTGDVIIPDDDKFLFGTGSDASISWDTSGTDHLAIATATSAVPITIGHATSEVTIGDNLTVTGNLTVDGTTTTINSTTLTVDDLNITLASGAADSSAANGAGITIDGASATLLYTHATTSWDMNKPLNVTGTGTFSGILKTDDTTDATSKTDGSLQTDGGLSVAKKIYNGTAATFAADSGIVTIGSSTAATFSAAGLLNINNATDATSKTDGSLQTDGGLSVAKAIYNGTAATLAADSGVVTIGSTTAATFSAAGLLNVNNATDATSKTDGSLQTDGGLSVAKKAYIGTGLTVEAGGAHLTAGRLTIDDATEATSTTDGSLQTDGGLSVAKSAVIGLDLTVSGDVTVNGGDITVAGATPKITIGDAGAEDAMLAFDGNAQDFHIALDDTADDLVIGVGTTAGTTTAIAINEAAQVSVVDLFAANVAGTFGTFTDGDATPSVATGNLWKHHASAQTIDMFDDGVAGQTIHVISTAAITYDFDESNLKCGSADIVTAAGDITSWFFDGTNWYLVQFMDVSADMSSVGGGDSVAADDISAGDAAVSIETTVGNITIDAAANNTDIIFKGTDATADITMLTLDGSDAGAAIFNSTVKATVFKPGVEVVSSANVIVSKGYTAITTAGSNRTATLPEATAALVGATYTIKKVDSGAGNVAVTAEGDGLIDTGATFVLYHQFESVTVICRAADVWDIM